MIKFDTATSLTETGHVRHGFFGRHGGVSTGEYEGLNVSTSTGDSIENVRENRDRVAQSLGGTLVTLKQVHSARVITIDSGLLPDPTTEADALVTRRDDILLGILTADCSPLLCLDPKSGVIGAAHAGWRGAIDGILANTVAAMEALGAHREDIILAIGPTISGVNYEVGQRFKDDVLALDPDAEAAFHVPPNGEAHFNLPAFLNAQAGKLGLAVTDTGLCTYADPARFYSHRYSTHHGTRTGRQISVIGLA
jgi:YfiH family protein